ncbi:MAG: glycosyltransferase family 2 protein [Acidobacteriota bacterium]
MLDSKRLQKPKSTDATPLISVIIPAYNAAQHITETIESVLNQTFKSFEIIVVNDGSPDTEALEQVLRPFAGKIIYLKKANGGPASARNAGIRKARGRFIALLDSDDIFLPEHLQEQLNFMETGEFDFVYCDAHLFGHSPLAGYSFMELVPSQGEVNFESLLAARCTVLTSTVVARKQPIMDAGLFDETHTQIIPAEDYDLWLRLAQRGTRMGFQKKKLINHRKHGDSLSANSLKAFEGALQVLENIQQIGSLSEREELLLNATRLQLTAAMELERGKHQLLKKDFQGAAEAIRFANQYYRRWKLRLVLLWLNLAPHSLLSAYLFRNRLQANFNSGKTETCG